MSQPLSGMTVEKCYDYEKDVSYPVKPGTINIILCIDAQLSEGALARALVTCTEAKTAAIQELLAPSC